MQMSQLWRKNRHYSWPQKERGLAHFLTTKCSSCDWKDEFLPKCVDPETRSCIVFREIGKGFEGLRSVCKNMDIPPPMQPNAFNNINTTLHSSYTAVNEVVAAVSHVCLSCRYWNQPGRHNTSLSYKS